MANEFEGSRIFLNVPVFAARDKDLLKKTKSLLLLGEIVSMLNTTGKFFMSNKTIAKRLDCTTQAVNNYLQLLEEKKLIVRTKVHDKNTNAIVGRIIKAGPALINARLLGLTTDVGEGSKQAFKGVVNERLYKDNNIKEQYKRTDINSASHSNAQRVPQLEEEFEEVWSKYPNKKGKKQAFNHYKAWRKASVKHTNEYLLERLKAYMTDLQQNSWKHPMNGSTWFNGRFDDELTTESIANKPRKKRIYD
ncbi:HTH domain-containing protein [Limosilactobacillus reuteri]|uniref:HTH domain-containing protein n=3 Tax=Limosilactobacillus reuteri TaxID=1598 RepID=UPI00146CF6FA|nr:HTH domain-containing protein [Limosilactobacillus reuteri]NMV61870.1 HTH domain-containing protein [Limosilactobacillus reuteri]